MEGSAPATGKGQAKLRMSSWQRWTMLAVILGSGIVFLDTSVVNLALPRIGAELPSPLLGFARLEAQSYVANAYFVTLSALLILAGALTDYYGRKRMFTVGLIGFLATSVLCGLAPNMELLILFRILQGATGALVVPGSLSIITASFEGEQQGRAFGLWAGASAATTILGPFIGGVLVNSISWRAAFFINVPFLLLALYATRTGVPETRDEQASSQFDWLGSLVVVAAVGGLAFGTIRGEQTEWQGIEAFIALGLGAAALVAFPIMMVKLPHPLVPPSMFRSRNFTITNASTFVIYGALYVFLSFQGLFLIGTLGYNEPAAGIAGLPATLFLVLLSTRFGKLAARYGPRLFMAAGPAVMALGLLYLTRFPADSEAWVLGTGAGGSILPPGAYFVDLLPSLLVFGIGLAIMVAPLTTALMTSVPKHNSGVASAINNAISRVGAPLVTALIFVAVVSSFYGSIEERVPGADTSSRAFRGQVAPLNPPEEGADPAVVAAAKEASTDAFHLAVLVAAGLMVVGAVVNGLGIKNPKKGREEPTEERGPAVPAERVDTIPEGVPCLPVISPTALPVDSRMGPPPDSS
ncbi:MAG: MFS transporter [Actinomycetota bacterium]|jgi:EmrB/QacA subfamily drug resistance transporter